MPVALGQVSRNIYDAAGALLQNKQIETQERIARAAQRGANQRAALGAAQSALGALNANSERAKDRQLQQQRDAEQRRLQQQAQRRSRLQQLLDAIAKQDEQWLREVDRMRQRGFMHSPQQQDDINVIDREHDRLRDLITDAINKGDMNGAEAVAERLFNEQQKRWKHVPRTEIPPEFKEVDGQKLMRDAAGNWEPIRNFAAEQAEKIKKDNDAHADRVATNRLRATAEARDAFNEVYQTGGTFNDALDAKNEILTTNGLPPSPMARKTPGDPGYYFNDPNKLSQAEKKLDKLEDYLQKRRDKIMDSLRDKTDDVGKPPYGPKELKEKFNEIWKSEGYQALEDRVQSERLGQPQQTQPSGQSSEGDGISQDYKDARQWMDDFNAKKDAGFRFGNPRQVYLQAKSVENFIKAYEGQNPDKFPQSQAAPKATTTAPAGAPQAQVARPQAAPQQTPQAAQPPVAPVAEPATPQAPQGPFKKGNFLNGPRPQQTSSLGGGGLGILASAPVPSSVLNALSGRSSSAATTQSEPASSESNVRDGVTYAPGFLRAWDAKYPGQPIPSSSSRQFQSARTLAEYQNELKARKGTAPPAYPLVRTTDDLKSLKPGTLYRELDGNVMRYEGLGPNGEFQSRPADKKVAAEPRGQSVGEKYQPEFTGQSLQRGMKPFRESGSTSRVSPEDSRRDQAYENAQGLGLTKFDGDDRWMRMTTTPGVDYSSRWEPVPESEVERLKSQGAGGVEFKEEKFDGSTRGVGGTELSPVKPEGYDERFQARVNQARLQAGQTPLLPDAESGPASLGRQAQAEKDQQDWKKQVDEAVKFYGLSGNGEHPKTADGEPASEAATFTARSKTIQLNDAMQQLDAKGELPPSLLEFPDKFPAWVTRLPAAKWTDKQGKEHHRNDVPTDEEGLQNLANEISKSKEIGKYSPEAKAAQQGEQPAAEGDDNAEFLPPSASAFAPEMQEDHLRRQKPPTKEAFEKSLRDNALTPQPGEYEDYLKAREEVRSKMPRSADTTAPGNLFLDKDGKLKQSDGKNGKPFPKDQPLPPGYRGLVPQPNQQPFQGQPQGQRQAPQQRQVGPMDIARGAAAARRNQAAEDARNPRQQLLDQMDRQKLEDARNFGQPPPVQKRLAPRPLDRKDFQIPQPGVPAGAGIQGRASFTPTFDDFSSQGQFPQRQFPSLDLGGNQPDFNNAIASSGFSPQYLPSQSSFQPTYQSSYAQPSFDQPFNYYEAPQYEQPYFQPQFDNFSNYQFQPQFEPVNYPSFPFDPYVGGFDNFYGVDGGGDFYGGGYGDGAYDYSSFA